MKKIITTLFIAVLCSCLSFGALAAKTDTEIFFGIIRYIAGLGCNIEFDLLDLNNDGKISLADANISAATLRDAKEDAEQVIVQRVVATPSYSFDNHAKTEGEDVELIVLSHRYIIDYDDYIDYGSTMIPSLGQIEFSKLGLPGSADDYFLSDIEITMEKVNGEYFVKEARALGTKETVSYENITLGTVSGDTNDRYYDGEAKKYKRISGQMMFGDKETYIFNAPYSFAQDVYTDKYNAQFITLDYFDGDEEEGHRFMNYVLVDDISLDESIIGSYDYSNDGVGYWNYNGYLSQLYFGGLGEADIYDCNGDGKIDYIFMKDYLVGTIDTTEGESAMWSDIESTYSPEEMIIFTDLSIVEGATFNDGDIVVAYVNPNANYVKVSCVPNKVVSDIETKARDYIVLRTGEKILIDHAQNVVMNGIACVADIKNASIDFNCEALYYFDVHSGKLVYVSEAPPTPITEEDLAVVLSRNVLTSTGLVDGVLQESVFVKAFINGEIMYVKAKKVIAPDPGKTANGVWNADYTPATYDKNTKTWLGYGDYVNKLATAKADKDGYYYFKLVDPISGYYTPTAEELAKDPTLTAAIKEENALLALEEKGEKEDEKNEYRAEKVASNFYQKFGYLYNLSDITTKTDDTTDPDDNVINGVYVKPYTKIIIKSQDKEGNEIVELYGYDNLPDIDKTLNFTNVSYILLNNVNSKVFENLAVFYGEVNGELEPALKTIDDIRILTDGKYDANNDAYLYDAMDLGRGKLQSDLTSTNDIYVFRNGDVFGYNTSDAIIESGIGWLGNIYKNGKPIIKGTESEYYGSGGWVELENYDPAYGMFDAQGSVFRADENTMVYFSNALEGMFEKADLSILESESTKYRQNDDLNEPLRLFMYVTDETDGDSDLCEYYVDQLVVVRQEPSLINIDEDAIRDDDVSEGLGVVLESRVFQSADSIQPTGSMQNYITIYNNGKIRTVDAKPIYGYLATANIPANYDRYYGAFDFSAYVNKKCEVKKDIKGRYYFVLDDFTVDTDIEVLASDDADAVYNSMVDESTVYNNIDGSITIDCISETVEDLAVDENTVILIKYFDENGNAQVQLFNSENLSSLLKDVWLEDVSFIIGNNPESETSEKLLYLYGECVHNIFTDEPEEEVFPCGTAIVLSNSIVNSTEMVNGRFVTSEYLNVYIDGKSKFVRVKRINKYSDYNDNDTPAVIDDYGYFDFSSYVNKLVNANCDSDGYHWFDIWDFENYNDVSVLASKDETAEYRRAVAQTKLYKVDGKLYCLSNEAEGNGIDGVFMTEDTKVIIKHYDKDGNTLFTKFDYNNLPSIRYGTVLTNVSYILKNNLSSSKYEYLEFLYGCVNGELEFESPEAVGFGVVVDYTITNTEESQLLYTYKLMNPNTGKIEWVPGSEFDYYVTFEKGDIVILREDGTVDNGLGYAAGNVYESAGYYNSADGDPEDYWWDLGWMEVSEYDSESGFLMLMDREEIFVVTEDTMVTFSDKSAESFKVVEADVLGGTSKVYRQNDDLDNALRVFICASPSEQYGEGFLDAQCVMLVRD